MPLQPKQIVQQRLVMAPNVSLALEILRMPTLELRAFLERQMEENPLLELDEAPEEDGEPSTEPTEPVEQATEELAPEFGEEWLAHWQMNGEQEADEEPVRDRHSPQPSAQPPQTLHEWLRVQLAGHTLSDGQRQATTLLIDQIDEHGYFDGSLEELSETAGIACELLTAALSLLQQLDPPGTGARDLQECLMIQLRHHQETESLAYGIV